MHDTVHLYTCIRMCKHICRKINRQNSNLADAAELVSLEGFFSHQHLSGMLHLVFPPHKDLEHAEVEEKPPGVI